MVQFSVPIWLLYVVAGTALAGAGIAIWWHQRPTVRSHDGNLLLMALNNMTQGVVMFDSMERLVICNDRYLDMYNLSRDVVKPGCTLLTIVQHRAAAGSLTRDPGEYRQELVSAMAQGRTLSARRRGASAPRTSSGSG